MKEESQDPTEKHVTPPFPKQEQEVPGVEDDMQPKADHGEQSYKGCGKLEGKKGL